MEDDDDEEDAATKVTLSLTTDDIHDEEKENRPAFFNASRTQKPKCARLFISDDEDEDEEENDDVDGDDAVEEMHEEEKEFLAMKDFFENEAELSGSELGSGDEREVPIWCHFQRVDFVDLWFTRHLVPLCNPLFVSDLFSRRISNSYVW